MIVDKCVIRYEVGCDLCGLYLGEFSDRSEGSQELLSHLRVFHSEETD